MATAVKKSSSAVVERSQRREVAVEVAGPSRREFLYYIWGASMVLLLGQATAALVWFALPRFKEGEFGGVFRFSGTGLEDVPDPGSAPVNVPSGRFWLSNTNEGFMVLYGVCTHLGCLPKWVETNNRFECPCHGSKFELDGGYIEGPAPRRLDRFPVTITFDTGESVSNDGTSGAPIALEGREIVEIAVDTGSRIDSPTLG